MADQKVSNLPALNGADVDSADLLYIVDSSAGTAGSKKITIGQYQLAPYSGATANTVVYFNGTKVPTSSSALTFDGTNLGIGTSSPLFKLDARGASGAGISYIETTTGNTNRIQLGATAGLGYINATAGTGSPSLQFQVADAEKMRLDSSGNLGLGVTPSAWSVIKAIQIGSSAGSSIYADNGSTIVGVASNAYYSSTGWRYFGTALASRYEQAIGAHAWYTAPSGTAGNAITFTQAMTLTSGGDLLVGTTGGNGAKINAETASPTGNYASNNTSGAATRYHFVVYESGTERGSITSNGTNTSYNTSSDARLKDNIQPAAAADALIDAIQIRSFDWKSNGSHQRYGVVAQELELVYPEAVTKPEDENRMMAVDYSKMVPLLIKEIQSLRARVAALEAK